VEPPVETTAADYAIARQAMTIAEQILDHPGDPDALATGRAFLAEHVDAAARARAWLAELAAVLDPAHTALIDRDLEQQYGGWVLGKTRAGLLAANDTPSGDPAFSAPWVAGSPYAST